MKAKRIYKYQEQYKKYMREDWDENIWFEWMKFCLVLKYQQIKPFRDLLNSTLQLSIIEDSTLHNGASALIWGARDMEKRNAIKTLRKQLKTNGYSNPDIKSYINNAYDNLGSGIYTGRNLMGRLLMELRDKKGILSYQLTANFTILGNRVNNKDCWNNHLKL